MNTVKKSPFTIYLVSGIAALAGLLFGFDTGIISGALLFIQQDFPLTITTKEFIVSAVLLGAMFGSLVCGRLTDQYGRRSILLVISGLFIAGTLISSCAVHVPGIMVGRLIIGLAIGISSYTAPLYIAEIAPLHLRGALVSFNQLAITLGIMCAYLINFSLTNTHGSWRWMFAVGILPAVLLFFGLFFLPESPRWLIKKGQLKKAKETLVRLRQVHNVDAEMADIQNSLSTRHVSFIEIFSNRFRSVLFLGIMLGFLQQVTGINTIIYYAPIIFQLAGFQDISSSIFATVGIGIVNVLATLFAIFYLDKIGRRPLLLTGIIGMGLSLTALSLAFRLGTQGNLLQWIAVISTFIYIICFAFSLGALLWLIVSEIFPLEIRGAAMSIAVFSCWFWNFAVSTTFLTLLSAIGPSYSFLLYAIMCALGFVFCYFKVPETNGVSLEQIEKNIRNGLPLRVIGQPVKKPLGALLPDTMS